MQITEYPSFAPNGENVQSLENRSVAQKRYTATILNPNVLVAMTNTKISYWYKRQSID